MDVIGSAHASSTLTVNQTPTYRNGDHFRGETKVSSSVYRVFNDVTTVGVPPDGTNKDIVTPFCYMRVFGNDLTNMPTLRVRAALDIGFVTPEEVAQDPSMVYSDDQIDALIKTIPPRNSKMVQGRGVCCYSCATVSHVTS